MQLERIYWLIGLVVVCIILVLIAMLHQRLRLQRDRYATYGARYRHDKEFSLTESEAGETRIIHPAYQASVESDLPPIPTPEVPRTLCFYVKAKIHEKFFGYDLLQAILNQGFVHGARDFFHYVTPQGYTLISLANAQAPGTFDLDQMGSFTTTGLCLFIQPQRLAKPFTAFDMMVDKAYQLAEELGGVVEDEHHHLLTSERLNDWRSRLVE